MDQLSALDSAFLEMESDAVQSNIGGISIFEGPAPTYDEVCERIARNVQFAPRCRQRVRALPGNLGHPVWVDDVDWDITNHVTLHDDPVDSLERLQEVFSEMVASHIDREHPLWKVRMIEELPDGEWAILWKVHHAMVDGIAATGVMSLLLDAEPDPEPPPADDWQPQDPPGVTTALRRSVEGVFQPSTTLPMLERAVRNPIGAVGTVASSFRTVLPTGRLLGRQAKSPINGEIGAGRVWCATAADLGEVKKIGKKFGGTVNDVVLASVTEGIANFLRLRGEDPAQTKIRAMVPVSVRGADEQGAVTNRVSAVFVDLPLGLADPVERMLDLCHQMGRRKEADSARAGEVMVELFEFAPPVLFTLGERALWNAAGARRLMNTVITNVPGPQFPLYCMGRRMKAFYPYVMLAKDIRVATAIFSYDGGIFFGVSGDLDTAPDVGNVCDGIDAGIAELARIAGTRKQPRRTAKR
jgi:WS/DGAT/MGAT family acyltransferase